jgi:hypothetical protein
MVELTSKNETKEFENEPSLFNIIENDKNSNNKKNFKENAKEPCNEQMKIFHYGEDKKLSSERSEESFFLFFNDATNKYYNEQIKDFFETEINLSDENNSASISLYCIDEIKEPDIEKIINVNNIEKKSDNNSNSELKNGILSITSSAIKFNIFEKRSDYSLYLFSKENSIRKFCYYITLQKWFENVILLFVALNCITLAIERPSILPTSIVSIFF